LGGAGAGSVVRLGKAGGGSAFVETMTEPPSPLIKSPFTTGGGPNIA